MLGCLQVLRAGQRTGSGAARADPGAPSEPDDRESLTSASAAGPETAEKRTRFSLSQELEGSIGERRRRRVDTRPERVVCKHQFSQIGTYCHTSVIAA